MAHKPTGNCDSISSRGKIFAFRHCNLYFLETQNNTAQVVVCFRLQYIQVFGQRPHYSLVFLQKSNIGFVEDVKLKFLHDSVE